jgi:hypothetical protein
MSFVTLLNARNEMGEILPVPATVKEVKRDKATKQVDLLVEIVPGVYGKTMEQESVKLKRYDPATDPRLQQRKTAAPMPGGPMMSNMPSYNSGSNRTSPILFLWIIGAVVLILGLLFIFIAGLG